MVHNIITYIIITMSFHGKVTAPCKSSRNGNHSSQNVCLVASSNVYKEATRRGLCWLCWVNILSSVIILLSCSYDALSWMKWCASEPNQFPEDHGPHNVILSEIAAIYYVHGGRGARIRFILDRNLVFPTYVTSISTSFLCVLI